MPTGPALQPGWPDQLAKLAGEVPCLAVEEKTSQTAGWRKRLNLPKLRALVARAITSESVNGTRLDNLICDGFLPLLSARTEHNHSGVWFHWYAGDLPPRLKAALCSLGVFDRRAQPACHGFAQGLLGWMLARESGPAAAVELEPSAAAEV